MENPTIENGPSRQQTQCRQCGTCCRQGGPTLHLEDLPLVEGGRIPVKALFTIRQGEPAYDNIKRVIAPAVTDIVKIKGGPRMGPGCWFYDRPQKICAQYDRRPAECRALKCWDTGEIERLYNCRRLTRRHILARVQGLWDLVTDHQERCDYGWVAELARRIQRNPEAGEAQKELLELIRFDESLRQVTMDRMDLDPEMMTFLFGRPLSFTVRMFRLGYDPHARTVTAGTVAGSQDAVCYRRNGFGPAGDA